MCWDKVCVLECVFKQQPDPVPIEINGNFTTDYKEAAEFSIKVKLHHASEFRQNN